MEDFNTKNAEHAIVLSGTVNYKQVMKTLTPEQKEFYLAMCKSVNAEDRTSLQTLGSEIIEANSRTANSLLSTTRSNDNQVIKDCLVETVKQLNLVNPRELNPDNKFRNLVLKIPILRHIVHSVDNMKVMSHTAEENINIIFDRMKASSRNLSTNNSTLEQMYIEGGNLIEHMNELILSLQLRLEKEEAKLSEMKNNESINSWDIQRQSGFVDSIKQEIANKMVSVQDMINTQMMICSLQSTNDALINACGTAINQTLPQWKKAIAMAIQASDTKDVVDSVNLLVEKGNQLILDTTETIAYSAVEAAKSTTSTAIKIQTLEQSQKRMFDAMKQVRRIVEDSKNQLSTIEASTLNLQAKREVELKALASK